jgi:hypothetical protein
MHPGLWLPPVKELHYFTHRERRLFAADYMGQRLRRLLRTRFRSDLLNLDFHGVRWDLRYFFGSPSDEWYASLFADGTPKIVGEITPEYSILSSEEVKRVRRSFPDLKLIYIMRDPIDRTWSQVRMIARNKRWQLDEVPVQRLVGLLEDPTIVSRGEYLRTLNNWNQHYPPDRFFIAFLEEVASNPKDLLVRLFSFLGIETPASLPDDYQRPINPGEKRPMPRILEQEIARIHLKDLQALEDRFGYPASNWRERAERVLCESRPRV